jgi:4-hydroxysphinganine ceramide fatty acyl 2-hydroxylase
MHRFLFHVDKWLPDNRWFLTLHFLLHGVHHYLPTDRYVNSPFKTDRRLRLVLPPALFIILAYPWYRLAHILFPYYYALAIFSGGVAGYIFYDTTHYFLHHRKFFFLISQELTACSLPSYWKELKRYHLAHHYKNFELGYGVTSKFWDAIFGKNPFMLRLMTGTELDIGPKVRSK